MNKYRVVVGLEVHIQLNTQSKAFCSDNAAFGGAPNAHISAISLAYPGTLPRPNKAHIESAIRLGLALGCQISQRTGFDRKNYFYADLPKGYQITQDAQPICVGGAVPITIEGIAKKVRLHHIHIEEDAGKSIHDAAPDVSLIDLNRAGVPLLEVVTDPDMSSGEEAAIFVAELRKIVRYLDISDGNMEQGSIRCDCNVSVMLADATVLGERCEVKNINSLRNIRRAIQYEAQRQIKVLEEGGTISSETRSFDAQTGTTFTLRSKESAEDYRYFPDPDLPPVLISDADLARIQAAMPAMPDVVAQELVQALKLSPYDAGLIASDRALWTYFQTLLQHKVAPKTAANWLLNAVQAFLNEKQVFIEDYPIPAERLAAVIILVETSQISKVSAETILIPALIAQPSALVLDLATQLELLQTNNKDEIAAFIEQIFTAYPDKVKEYQKGKKGLLGFFVGETVRLAKGKIDAKTANGLWLERLKINP